MTLRMVVVATISSVFGFAVGVVGVSIVGQDDQKSDRDDESSSEVAIAPEPCLLALDKAEEIEQAMAEFARIAEGFAVLLPRAIEAGAERDRPALDRILADAEEVNGRMQAAVESMREPLPIFDEAKADCRDLAS
jgi:hypothetical protein